MEVFIVGLILYVILSVIGEVSKKGKNTPPTQTGGGKVIPFPSDPTARRKTFQDVLREALEEASLEGQDAQRGADDTFDTEMEGTFQGTEGTLFETESDAGFSSEGIGSLEGSPVADGSLGGSLVADGSLEGDPRGGSLGPIPEDAYSSGGMLKSSLSEEELVRWEREDVVDFDDDFEDAADSRFSYGDIGFSDNDSNASSAFLHGGLLATEEDLLRGIIVSELMNARGGRSLLKRGACRTNRL
ncbi:MAG TPA: hypothetical protein DDZ65_04415 [Firmicutes bacterium]|nr:hypothetical protein [Bacillota bacterium]